MSENQSITVEKDNIAYSINKQENTASVRYCNIKCFDFIIPRSIIYNSKEYIVTSILEKAFFGSLAKSIQFASNSEIRTIERYSLNIKLESITIPSKLVDLQEGWCSTAPNLTRVNVSPQNPRYRSIDNKFIIGKKSIEQTNFDCFVFCSRDVKNIAIPSYIKHIDPYAFDKCKQLRSIQITDDSKLCSIGRSSFSYSSIVSITIPSKLVDLQEGWCNATPNLTRVNVSPNNPRYRSIGNKFIIGKTSIKQTSFDCFVFCSRDVKSITIPSCIKHISPFSFSDCENLQKVEFASDSKLQTIENSAFSSSSIEAITIPSEVNRIGKSAFFNCAKLKRINLNSKLQTIENFAFASSSIESVGIPSNLIDLNEGWCNSTSKLNTISVSKNNPRYFCLNDQFIIGKSSLNSKNYDELVFCVRNVKNVVLPNFIEQICSFAFDECKQLQKFEIQNNSKLRLIEKSSFMKSSIKSIKIPPSVTKIGEFAFSQCMLQNIKITNDSNLQIIEKGSFQSTLIERIFIPQQVTKICTRAFYNCKELKRIEITENSKLQIIGNLAFAFASIESLSIPPQVRIIGENAFEYCTKLLIIEFNEKSKINYIDQKWFQNSESVIVMIHRNHFI